MEHRQKHSAGTGISIIAVSLILICQNINAQPGYPPRLRMPPPPRYVAVPYQPGQSDRQVYSQYNNAGGFRPFISFSIHFDPLVSWFSTDSYDTRSDGAVPGFNFGLSYNNYFSPNYSFSSGINIINAGGRLVNRETTIFELENYSSVTVPAGAAITYRITYLSIPLGLKLQTSQLGYGRFYTDLGFDPKIVIRGRADIPSIDIHGGNALPELNIFNLSFHIMAGMEYPLAGNNSFIFGLGFENNLFDTTRDNGGRPSDQVFQKFLSFRFGITF
jgi:Outer membrane protein beta-barrel domain